jgi:hypothetical protein
VRLFSRICPPFARGALAVFCSRAKIRPSRFGIGGENGLCPGLKPAGDANALDHGRACLSGTAKERAPGRRGGLATSALVKDQPRRGTSADRGNHASGPCRCSGETTSPSVLDAPGIRIVHARRQRALA